jgi:hypothetical protein
MLDIARVLADQLRQVDTVHRKLLCLDYAQHVLQECRDVLTPEQWDLSAGYLTAARQLLDGEGGSMTALADVHHAYLRRFDGDRRADEVAWVVLLGVSACWQRELKAEGLVQSQLVDVTVMAVSQDGQRVVGSHGGSSRAEAGWQLTHLLGTAPSTFDLRPLSHLFSAADDRQAKILALDYTAHALRECRRELTSTQLDTALAYLAAAKDFVAGAGTEAALSAAQTGYTAGRQGAERITWLTQRTVNVVTGQSTLDIRAAARHARSVILTHARADMAKARIAQWNEERWQLIRLLEILSDAWPSV